MHTLDKEMVRKRNAIATDRRFAERPIWHRCCLANDDVRSNRRADYCLKVFSMTEDWCVGDLNAS
jgi:hypothetical protein